MYLLGYDIGSSSIKAALVSIETGEKVAVVQSPAKEMDILAPKTGWAEQAPETWWNNVCLATKELLNKTDVKPAEIKGIGIAYQMHGLVLVDKNQQVLRPSIIWCDSRAVDIGNQAFTEIGEEKCLSNLLNSPGNFTASKLKWVQNEEPRVYEKIHKFMLPGEYIAMKFTGEILTTPAGLSEGIFWDFNKNEVAGFLLDYFGFSREMIPDIVSTFSLQGRLTKQAAEEAGLAEGIPVAYRAGDQPNNALSLNVLNPGEVAATGGTSGVVYGVVDRPYFDPQSRVNGFVHVNHEALNPRFGILLCINGAGIQYSWVRQQLTSGMAYTDMEIQAASVPPGSEGLRILPFGNGAERMLGNKEPGSTINNLHFTRHTHAHVYRATLEGIAFSFVYGMGILNEMGLNAQIIRVGNDNLFQSAVFSNTIANLIGSKIEVLETTGAVGAAKAAGVATGFWSSIEEAVKGGKVLLTYEPTNANGVYREAYQAWTNDLKNVL